MAHDNFFYLHSVWTRGQKAQSTLRRTETEWRPSWRRAAIPWRPITYFLGPVWAANFGTTLRQEGWPNDCSRSAGRNATFPRGMTFFLVPLGIFFDYIAMAVARIEYILIKSCPVTIHRRCFCFFTNWIVIKCVESNWLRGKIYLTRLSNTRRNLFKRHLLELLK